MNKKLLVSLFCGALLSVGGFYLLRMQRQENTLTIGNQSEKSNQAGKPEAEASSQVKAMPLVNSAPLANEDSLPASAQQQAKIGPSSSPDKQQLLEKLIDTHKHDFDNVRNFITSSLSEVAAQLSEDLEDEGNDETQQKLMEKINKITQDTLDYVEKRIAEAYDEKFSPEELQELIRLQEDPVIQAVKENMNQDYQDFKQEYSQFIETLPDNPPSQQREEILREMVENSNIKEVFETLNNNLGGEGDSALDPQHNKAQESEFNQQIQALKEQSYQGLLFALRHTSDDQLSHFNKIQKHPVMQKGQNVQRELVPKMIGHTFKTVMKALDES